MPMIDVYAAVGTFADKHALAAPFDAGGRGVRGERIG
jgi:hypothetical protein